MTTVFLLLLASCGMAKPDFDDGTFAAWIASSLLAGVDNDTEVSVDWSAQPTFDDIKSVYPADAHGLINIALKCQLRRDSGSAGCAFVEGAPDTDAVRQGGLALAKLFKIDPAALKVRDPSKPFASVNIAICKRADPKASEDECVQPAMKAEPETTVVQDKPPA